jgi:hypothetical protein
MRPPGKEWNAAALDIEWTLLPFSKIPPCHSRYLIRVFMWKSTFIKYDRFVVHALSGSARRLEVKIRPRLHRQQQSSFHNQPSAYRITPASTLGDSYMASPWSHQPGLLVFA